MGRRPDWARSSGRTAGDRHAPDDLWLDKRPRTTGSGVQPRLATERGTDGRTDVVAALSGTGTNLRRAERTTVGRDRCFIAAVVSVVVSEVMYWPTSPAPIYRRRCLVAAGCPRQIVIPSPDFGRTVLHVELGPLPRIVRQCSLAGVLLDFLVLQTVINAGCV